MRVCLAKLTGYLIVLLLISCTGPLTNVQTATQAAEKNQSTVPQDPALEIATQDVANLLAGPDAEQYFLVDARPSHKFDEGHVPGAVSIPKTHLKENLDKLPRNKTIIFYCGGLHCKLSAESANIAQQNGFTNIKVWYEGIPRWLQAGNYSEIETKAVEKLVMSSQRIAFALIDARPTVKYQKSFIPGALSLPKAEFKLKKGLLPADRSLPIIFYCGGYQCDLSRQSAELALGLGYRNVSVYAAGAPGWKKAGLPFWGNDASGIVAKQPPTGALPEALTSDEFEKLYPKGELTLIDVRSAEDFASGHLPGAINIYDEDFIFKAEESVARLPSNGRVVLYCATGSRAGGAYYAILGESDYGNKHNLQYLDAKVTIAADGSFNIAKMK